MIVVGASAGGLESLAAVLKDLSPEFPAAILGVIHIGAHEVNLPNYFAACSALPVGYAKDGEPIAAGKVSLAPPDRHLIVEQGYLHLGRGPKENHTRPAIDPLFRSAAENYGPLVIGAVLTGFLTDGTAGLWEVKRRGGIAIVQDPDEAEVPSMPLSALRYVKVDHCVGIAEFGPLLNRLAVEAVKTASQVVLMAAAGEGVTMDYTYETPAALTCPDCGGALGKRRSAATPIPLSHRPRFWYQRNGARAIRSARSHS
jgi:two-component system chemotaxis response regulator CheB